MRRAERRWAWPKERRRLSGRAAAAVLVLTSWFWAGSAESLPAQPADATASKTPAAAVANPAVEQCGTSIAPVPDSSAKRKSKRRRIRNKPPSAAELRAFEALEQEAQNYERDAKEYRKSLNRIVRHHYEDRRRRVLSGLDQEIGIERAGLDRARDTAIQRLEMFIARYSGPNVDPQATPDAMFRLAALYEERGRLRSEADLAKALAPAMSMYRRIILEFPGYEEIASVHYHLGHALNDAGRIDQAQQAWRVVVCKNKFSIKADPSKPSEIVSGALIGDHDPKFWNEWYNRNPVPLDQARRPKNKGAPSSEEELTYRDPYSDCEPLPQKVEPGDEPRYLAEIWWQIGNYHFDQVDVGGGPYTLNRAVSAYEHSLAYKKPPIYGVSLYKLAWTYFKQQRYRTAVDAFVRLLHYADEQEKRTGDPGADFRAEAHTYIAGSLTYLDFDGPPAEHPYIARNDVLDTETNPVRAEQKLAVAVDRAQDPKLIPQDKKWTVEIYKALAQEFIDITHNRNAIAMLELALRRFPMDREAPVMQNKAAQLYDQMAKLAPEASAAHEEYAAKALEARTKLAAFVGNSPWTQANRDDPEALEQAEQLVKKGLKGAASDHTNYARNDYTRALEKNDATEQKKLLEKAITEYRLAQTGWLAYLQQDRAAPDAYESSFWLADAGYWVVVLQVAVGRSPAASEVQAAREAAVAVRDSNEDDKYQQPAAFYLVSMADKLLEDEYRRHEANHAQGLERRQELKFAGEGEQRRVVKQAVPAQIAGAIQARDEYNARIPLERDPQKNGMLYAFQAGDWYFVYGDFEKARARFRPMYQGCCGQNEWGYKAWEKLISMSNFENNVDESRKLAEGKSCAFNEETKVAEEKIRKPVRQGVAYLDARRLYDAAEKMPEGPERDKKWRAAAAAYKVALDAAPDRDEAPEAAMNGAYAYKQVGEYDKAIAMYELFISKYGSEDMLRKLREGDPKAEPPKAANPKKYEERVGYLKNAYDALAGAYVLFFNYPRAAETFDKISQNAHFTPTDRREAARQSLSLYASLGDQGGMLRARGRFTELGASPKESAEADFLAASSELKKWDQFSPNEGRNAAARRDAERAMEGYYAANKNRDGAAQYLVQSAYWAAKTKYAAQSGDTNAWWSTTIHAFERWKQLAPTEKGKSTALGSYEASLAAEAEYVMLDQEIAQKFDYESGHHRFKGTPVQVIDRYKKDALEAKQWYDKLQHVTDAYVSPEWTTAAVSRQGSLYDSLRTGLYNTRPPDLRMFDAKQEALLKRAETSENPDLQEKADAIRISVQQGWRDRRDRELEAADRVVIDRYATSVVLARRYNISSRPVTNAIRRLAFLTDVIGEAKISAYTSTIKDLKYTPGMFLKMRPGLVTAPAPEGLPAPLPAFAQ